MLEKKGRGAVNRESTLRAIGRSAGVYPITLLYLCSVALIVMVAGNVLSPGVAVSILAFGAILAATFASWRELRIVRKLVMGQRTELIARVDQLSELLTSSGVDFPQGSQLEGEAREDERLRRSSP